MYASPLLEGELWSAAVREGLPEEAVVRALAEVHWVLPDRSLSREIRQVLEVGTLRGADAWHLACALYAVDYPARLPFVTLDEPQARVARALGFPVEGIRLTTRGR